jgi:hypothetical protein
MGWITFRCSSCKQGLKVGADKAGRKIKCTKCGTPLTIPAASPNEPAKGAKPAPTASSGKHGFEEDEDAGGVYGIDLSSEAKPETPEPQRRLAKDKDEDDEGAEEEEELDPEEIAERDEALRRRLLGLAEGEEDEEQEENRPRRRKPRAKLDPQALQRVRLASILVVASVGILGVAVLLRQVSVLVGLFSPSTYGQVVDELHPHYQLPFNEENTVEVPRLVVALFGGLTNLDTNLLLIRLGQVLMIFQGGVMVAACVICLPAPKRFGAKGLILATLIVASVNLLTGILFRLLPMVGAMNFLLVPLVGPEIAMKDSNIDRILPLHLLWSGNPYLQVLITVFVILCSFAELALFPLFMRAIAQTVKSDKLEQKTLSFIQLAVSQIFMQLAYQLLAMAGTSDVMIAYILPAVYWLAFGFFIWQLVWYVLLLLEARTVIQTALRRQERELRRDAEAEAS